ncbi:chain length-determining protein [Celeribacter arenosi]|uniref:Wzz/FepE/Etk N-terminal domain-containing protein n=1 Tax=Celeribacter arenosi TaxID=792649 RepID=A0ABP7K7B0_9RHOB
MNLDLRFYWKLFLRRLPVMMAFIIICSGLSAVTAIKTPETWRTQARLLVEEPQIPSSMVRSTVQTSDIEQLDIVQQKLLTRANLIDIANRLNVFQDIRSMAPDTVFDQMRAATSIRRIAGKNSATMMTIAFTARSGQVAANVVNEYVTLILEENTKSRQGRVANTLEFFQQEVQRLASDLDQQSIAISVFKSENANALPENQSYRLNRQSLLQERLSQLNRDLAASRKQREDMIAIFEATGQVRQSQGVRRTAQEEELIVVQAELDHLKSLYPDTDRRVIRIQAQLDKLQAIVAAQAAANSNSTGPQSEVSAERAILDSSLAEIDSRTEAIQTDIDTLTKELADLETAIIESSANGIELATLEREFNIVQARYNAAVSNLDQARMNERIEASAQGQRISVIENASVPRVPAGPNRVKIAAMGTAIGLGLAAGYFLLLEFINRTIRRPQELTGKFDVTPIAIIPYMESRREKTMRRTGMVAATLVVLIGTPLALWYIDTNYIPLDQLVRRGLSRFGIG